MIELGGQHLILWARTLDKPSLAFGKKYPIVFKYYYKKMASKKAQELAEQLLGMSPSAGSSAVEGVMAGGHMGCGQYGGGFDGVKDFYGKHKTPVLAIGTIIGVAVIGLAGYGIYKKWIWKAPPVTSAAHYAQDDEE
jgi:hypothetical protein